LLCEDDAERRHIYAIQSTRFLEGILVFISSTYTRFQFGNIQLQQVFQTVSTTAAALGNVANDIRNRGKDFPTTVGQQCRSLNMIHLGNFMMQLDKAGSRLPAGNSDEAFLDNGTVIRLEAYQKLDKKVERSIGSQNIREDHKCTQPRQSPR
jgi:hypothetical protein